MGHLITIEGGEFTGKTSVMVPSLRDILDAVGIKVKVSREPGGTPEAERIRGQIFSRLREGAGQEELAILFNEARRTHLHDVILPFLGPDRSKDGVLILDRYLDSTRVYQGLEGGVPLETLAGYEKDYANSFYPDLTLIAYFQEDGFAETFEMRSQFANKKDEGGRSRTAWDEGDVQAHIKRQRHYLALPDTYSKMGIAREFAEVDVSKHPFDVIKEVVIQVGRVLGKSSVLLREYGRLLREGKWDKLDGFWREQHEGYRASKGGGALI